MRWKIRLNSSPQSCGMRLRAARQPYLDLQGGVPAHRQPPADFAASRLRV